MDVIITSKNRPKRVRTTSGRHTGGTEKTGDESGAASREVTDDDDGKTSAVDDFMSRVRKLVPADVTAAYTVLVAIAATASDMSSKYALPVALFIGTVVTVLALRQAGKNHAPPVAPLKRQYVITLLAFWAWGCSIRDPLEGFGYFIPTWILLFAIVTVPTLGAYLIATDAASDGDAEVA